MRKKYIRNCPSCNKEITYSFASGYCYAKKINCVCKSCVKLGHVAWNKGIPRTNEEKKKMSLANKGYVMPEEQKLKISKTHIKRYKNKTEREKISISVKLAMHRPDVRKKHIKSLLKSNYLGRTVDIGQVELLNKWNLLGFDFQLNYKLHTDNFLCYLDGYDNKRNIVLEYDSKYHKKLSQKKKDIQRQQKIIELLNPKKFWRYDAVNKKWINILD